MFGYILVNDKQIEEQIDLLRKQLDALRDTVHEISDNTYIRVVLTSE